MEEKPPVEQLKKGGGGKTYLKIFLVVFAVLSLLLLLVVGAGALAGASAGLVKVPVLSKLIKPPAVTEDFSYQVVSEEALADKFARLKGEEGPVEIVLTDDEVNSLITSQMAQAQGLVKSILVKFSAGIIKVTGVLSENDISFYGEVHLAKSADQFEFEIQQARLGALPIPGFLIEESIGRFLGTGPRLGKPTAESIPVDEVIVQDGSITIKGLELSGLTPSQEGSSTR